MGTPVLVSRGGIIRGPAIITLGSNAPVYTKGDITLTVDNDLFTVPTAMFGTVDQRVNNRVIKASFEPSGMLTSDGSTFEVGWMFPYASAAIGSSVFGSSDTGCTIQTLAGQLFTWVASAVTKMPDFIFSSVKTVIGSMEITFINTNDAQWSGANSVVTVSSNAFADTSFVATDILTQPYGAVWGSTAPWGATPFDTQDGWNISHSLTLKPVETDAQGLVDMTFVDLVTTAKCKPVLPTETQMIAAPLIQNTGAIRGRSLAGTGNTAPLTITGESGVGLFVLNQCNIKGANQAFGSGTLRVGEVTWIGTRLFSSGAAQPVFAFTSS